MENLTKINAKKKKKPWNISSSVNIFARVTSDFHQRWRLFNDEDNIYHDPTLF